MNNPFTIKAEETVFVERRDLLIVNYLTVAIDNRVFVTHRIVTVDFNFGILRHVVGEGSVLTNMGFLVSVEVSI